MTTGDAIARRREALSRHASLCGIDYVDASACLASGVLRVHFVAPATEAGDKRAVPAGLGPENLRVAVVGTGRRFAVASVAVPSDAAAVLEVVLAERPTDFNARYELRVHGHSGMDVRCASGVFLLGAQTEEGHGTAADGTPVTAREPTAHIDYLSKDFASFRDLMLEHMSRHAPQWRERHAADLGVVLVEALAYAGDHLSYFQDAVATEAYLGTARRRASIRRHGRLMDYHLHEGCTARTFVCFEVDADDVPLPARSMLLAGLTDGPATLAPEQFADLRLASSSHVEIFETLHDAVLQQAHNRIEIHGWGAERFALEAGATSATLKGRLETLRAGDVLVFDPQTGTGPPVDEGSNEGTRAHAVRLLSVRSAHDPLCDEPVTEIAWRVGDALPGRLDVCAPAERGRGGASLLVVRGNAVLAEHGRTIHDELLVPPRDAVHFRSRLRYPNLLLAVPYGHEHMVDRPAVEALQVDPGCAVPIVEVREEPGDTAGVDQNGPPTGRRWGVARDLLGADSTSRVFAVEIESDAGAHLLFGDGRHGRRPAGNSTLRATYRTGGGKVGNVARGTVRHLVGTDERVVAVVNPLGAQGGVDRESIATARRAIAHAYRVPARCITAGDYAQAVRSHPSVLDARGRTLWTGAWRAVCVHVLTLSGTLDERLARELMAHLDDRRACGHEVRVVPPRRVRVTIEMSVDVAPGHLPARVRTALHALFAKVFSPGGGLGFGETLYASRVIELAQRTAGVQSVELRRLQRADRPRANGVLDGITAADTEIVCLDDDPARPAGSGVVLDTRMRVS